MEQRGSQRTLPPRVYELSPGERARFFAGYRANVAAQLMSRWRTRWHVTYPFSPWSPLDDWSRAPEPYYVEVLEHHWHEHLKYRRERGAWLVRRYLLLLAIVVVGAVAYGWAADSSLLRVAATEARVLFVIAGFLMSAAILIAGMWALGRGIGMREREYFQYWLKDFLMGVRAPHG